MHGTPLETTSLDRQQQIQAVVARLLTQRAAGESLSDEAVCAEHASLMPELAAELRKLKVIGQARAIVERERTPVPEGSAEETAALVNARSRSPRLSRSLHIRCPLCHQPLEIATDQALDDVQCSACQGRFSLAGDDPDLREQKPVTQIGHFQLIQRLGMGGFGTVWKAVDTQLERTVALKIPRRGSLSPEQVEAFLYEARVAAKLRHPNIVIVHEIGREGDNVYIASDLVEGASLDKYKDRQRLTHQESAELMIKICDALHFAHEAGVVHRDLKPGNILVDECSQPHITDFGLAKRPGGVEITAHGEIVGTPAYMSPEQARGESHLADRRTDVYALGVILFELLTDFLPFRGNVMMLAHHAVHTEPPSPRRLNATVSPDLETICLKCLEKDPAKRYASAKELADELRRFLAGDPILARPISRGERFVRWCRKNPRVPILSLALLAVVFLAYASAWLWFQDIYENTRYTLTQRALDNVAFTAESVAAAAGRDLAQYFDLVEEAASDDSLIDLLAAWQDDQQLMQLSSQLSHPSKQGRDDEETRRLRDQLERHPRCRSLQAWTDEYAQGRGVFATFILLPDGLQIARCPVVTEEAKKTFGRNNAWRAYFHGGPEDKPERWRPAADHDRIQSSHLSPPFVSQFTDEWVIAVSTPIVDRRGSSATASRPANSPAPVLGIVGVMISLEALARLPHAVHSNDQAASDTHFAVLIDSRTVNHGQVLQHPLYDRLSKQPRPGQKVSDRRLLLDDARQPELRVPLEDGQRQADYRDPFAARDNHFEGRWLAAQLPVHVSGKPAGISVVVQESYDQLIGQPLGKMRRALFALSLVTLCLTAAVVIPLWAIILRLVR